MSQTTALILLVGLYALPLAIWAMVMTGSSRRSKAKRGLTELHGEDVRTPRIATVLATAGVKLLAQPFLVGSDAVGTVRGSVPRGAPNRHRVWRSLSTGGVSLFEVTPSSKVSGDRDRPAPPTAPAV